MAITKTQKIYLEKKGALPNSLPKLQNKFDWPILQQWKNEGFLSYIDYALAETLLSSFPIKTEGLAALICHLSLATRRGHLCIKIKDKILPEPVYLWKENLDIERESPVSRNFSEIESLIFEGAKQFNLETAVQDDKVMQNFDLESFASVAHHSQMVKAAAITNDYNSKGYLNLPPSTAVSRFKQYDHSPIIRAKDNYYFLRLWKQENKFLEHLKCLLVQQPKIELSLNDLHEKLQSLKRDKILLSEQAEAIVAAATQNFTVITGGPGTGKTYTIGYLVKLFIELLPDSYRDTFEIALSAPTGKAASHLHASILRSITGQICCQNITSQTLHSLLEIQSKKTSIPKKILSADLIIVDESSMIDVDVMVKLLSSLKPGARLILLGDQYQLPPVETGSLFFDLVTYLSTSQDRTKHIAELQTCMRVEFRGILDLSRAINRGASEEVLDLLQKTPSLPGLEFYPMSKNTDPKIIQKKLLPLLPRISKESIFSELTSLRLLSPVRKGPLGIETLNHWLLEHSLETSLDNDWFAAPILITRNDYKLELFNGEAGFLFRKMPLSNPHEKTFKPGDHAIFPSKNILDPSVRRIPALLLPQFDYAYCLSVHKSQGSEFDHVVLILPEDAPMIGRELLYTAATRARKKLEIWGNEDTIRGIVKNSSKRLSGIVN